jgi:hypothetical protein
LGVTGSQPTSLYTGLSGPTSFGSGGLKLANSGSGDRVAVVGDDEELQVPSGYVSGNPLSDTLTFTGTTLAALGLTDGTYTWTWDSGANDVVLYVGVAATPLPAAFPLFASGLGFIGFLTKRRKRKAVTA